MGKGENMSDKYPNQKMSFTGIGPYIIGLIVILTIIGLYLNFNGYLDSGLVKNNLTIIIDVIAILIIITCVIMYISALFISKIGIKIKENKLVTDGVFSIVRNPIYTSLTGICVGVLLFFHNLWFILWIISFYIILKITIPIEEKTLEKEFNEEFINYKKRVNQVIPFFKFK